MFGWLAESAREAYRRDRSRPSELTPRELEVLRLIEEHLSNKQIARRLSLSSIHGEEPRSQHRGEAQGVRSARGRGIRPPPALVDEIEAAWFVTARHLMIPLQPATCAAIALASPLTACAWKARRRGDGQRRTFFSRASSRLASSSSNDLLIPVATRKQSAIPK